MPAHSKLAPSAASRWSVCTASIGFIEANAKILPKDSSSDFADEGTFAHAVAAHLFGCGPMPECPKDTAGKDKFNVKEVLAYAGDYVKHVLSRKASDADKHIVERKVPLFYLLEQYGTVDSALFVRQEKLTIFIDDLKYGAGVSVIAKDNKQLAIYAESLIQELSEVEDIPDDTLVVLGIYQPRDRSNPEPVRLWALSRKELREFCADIQGAAMLILDPKNRNQLQFVADPDVQCRWCPAKGICKHYGTHGLEAIPGSDLVQVEVVLPDANALTREQRIRVIQSRKALESWLEAVENQEVLELMAGAAPMGMKLVAGKTNRVWVNEEEADKLLANHLTAEQRRKPWEVLSVAQAEKALKGLTLSTKFENRMSELITKPEGKPSLVPATDKRPALEFNPAAGLTEVVTDEDVL